MATNKPSSSSASPRKRRRRAKSTTPTPFLDVTASIVASAFAASRLTEIQQLTNRAIVVDDGTSLKSSLATTTTIPLDETPYQSGGCKTATRHLRRRATSHQSRNRHRYPRGNGPKVHNNDVNNSVPNSRKGRRQKKLLLQAPHRQWTDELTAKAMTIETKTNNEVVQWLPTHIWHAKRFHMETLFGWKVPMLHTQRGAKAALRLVREEHCVIQDVTWRTRTIEWTVKQDDASNSPAFLSRIISDFRFDNSQADVIQSGQGILHRLDQYPMSALGPIEWMILPGFKSNNTERITTIRLSVHPALVQTLWEMLTQIIPEKTDNQPKVVTFATLVLRGKKSRECLVNTLQNFTPQDLAVHIPTDMPHFGSIRLDNLTTVPSNHLSLQQKADPVQSACDLIFTRIAPRSSQHACNWGVCGFQITGPPDDLARVFHELVVKGQACPIGIVEESHLQLECDPPLLHFPRDFVDTPSGHDYWKAEVGNEWYAIRQWQEGGLGRIRPASSFPSVSFANLFSNNHVGDVIDGSDDPKGSSETTPSIVVVRGAFGQPIWDLLQHSSTPAAPQPFNSSEAHSDRKLKRRRPSGNPTNVVRLPIAAASWRAQYQAQCATLRQSMTLPALLLAHVRVEGSGVVTPGMTLHFFEKDSKDPLVLGYVLSGAASHHRGRSHGMAAVAASAFLQAMESTSSMPSGHPHQGFVSVPNIKTGARVTSLLVPVGQGKEVCTVSLSLIL